MSDVIDTTYCDECEDELEIGQTGKCDQCRIYNFEDLYDKAKQHAREAFTSKDYPENEWWEDVYEDAGRVAELLGIEFDTTPVRLRNGKTRHDPKLFFSGFCSQGDGACYEGVLNVKACAQEIAEYAPKDVELQRIANELTVMAVKHKFGNHEFSLAATATVDSRYSHSGSMTVRLSDDLTDLENDAFICVENTLQTLMRDFADWIYNQLETANDWLHSDECVDQYLEQDKFDVNGNAI
jgi:hypothetical protein